MNEIITTKSIARNIAEVEEDFILCEESMSRLVFSAQIHDGGIRGKIIRHRRESKNDIWISEKAIPINTLGKNETINLNIKTEGIKKLYLAILKLANILKEKGIEYGENKYVVSDFDPNQIIVTDENKTEYIKKIIDAGYDEDVWKYLSESNPSLATKLSYAKILQIKKEVLNELKCRLSDTNGFPETEGDNSWQKWIYKHNWLFGVNYKKPIEKTKINITGIMPDYLFPTLDGFVDILEIKLPKDEIIIKDSNHSGSWRWSSETNRPGARETVTRGEVAGIMYPTMI